MTESGSRLGRTWAPLCRLGAASAAVVVLAYGAALVIVSFTSAPQQAAGEELLAHVAAHRTVYVLLQVLWLLPNLPMMVLFLAVAVALQHHGPSLAAVAGTVGVSAWAVAFAWPTTGGGSLAMVVLSDRHAAASTESERASLVASAELLDALNTVPSAIGVLQTLGILLAGVLMLRGTVGKPLGWLGVVTGVVGMASEVLRPVLGGVYAVYGVLLLVWLCAVAVALWRLARAPARVAGA